MKPACFLSGVFQTGIGMSTSGGAKGAHRLGHFLSKVFREKGVDDNGLAAPHQKSNSVSPSGRCKVAYGYEATILADICDFVFKGAERLKNYRKQQRNILPISASYFFAGSPRVGISRSSMKRLAINETETRDSLARILEASLQKELQPWVRTFLQIITKKCSAYARLPYKADSVKRPPYFGHLTNDIVYDRLAPEVLEQLKMRVPRN